MKTYVFALLLIPLLVLVASPSIIQDAQALKAMGSDGTMSPKSYGSNNNMVCGDKLCSEIMMSNVDSKWKNIMMYNMNMNMMISNMEMLMSNMMMTEEMDMMTEDIMTDYSMMMDMMMEQMMNMMMGMSKSTMMMK